MTDFGNDFQIRVTTEEMKAKAETVASIVDVFSNQFEMLEQKMNATAGYWIGNGGDAKRAINVQRMKEAEEIIRFLRAYTPDLMQMAGIYEEGESHNAQTAESLSADVII